MKLVLNNLPLDLSVEAFCPTLRVLKNALAKSEALRVVGLGLALTFACATNCATMVPFQEDVSAVQAAQEIADDASRAAERMGFKGEYEIVSPTRMGIEVNPWNKFIASGINPFTKRSIVIVNPEWYSALSAEKKNFWMNSIFIKSIEGDLPFETKALPWVYTLLSFLAIFGLAVLLKRFVNYNKWIRFGLALAIVALYNNTIDIRVYNKIVEHFNSKYALRLNEKAISKGISRDVAIEALMELDQAIKQDLQAGQVFWKPFENKYAERATDLKK